MPLYIDGELVGQSSNVYPLELFEAYPQLRDNSKNFIQTNEDVWLQKSDRVLYVHQREYAVISSTVNKQNFNYICTDDATTCHVVVLMERKCGIIGLGHFDGVETEKSFSKIFQEVVAIFEKCRVSGNKMEVELYLFGGFIDEKKYSEKLFIDLLSSCRKLDYDVTLKLACCHSLNNKANNGLHTPEIYGIAVNIKKHEIIRGRCLERGPDYVLRKVRNMFNNTMCQIYDNISSSVCIDPFTIESISYANYLLQLDDKSFLEIMSTSPHCEPPHFVSDVRSSILFALKWKNKEDKLFCNKKRQFVLNNLGEWVLCHSDQIEIS